MPPEPDRRASCDDVADAWERLRRTARGPSVDASPPIDDEPSLVDAHAASVLRPPARHAIPVDWSRPMRALVVIAVVAAVVAIGLFWQAAPRPVDGVAGGPVSIGSSAADAMSGAASSTSDPSAGAQFVVHVVGAVRRPGVVRVPPGSRVADAIAAAGGLTSNARSAAINLARPVLDGEQIVVSGPSPAGGAGAGGVAAASPGGSDSNGLLDLNQASVDDFEALDGIGPVLAERIVAWRGEHGRFASVDDLRDVSGIGPKIFDRLKDQVRV